MTTYVIVNGDLVEKDTGLICENMDGIDRIIKSGKFPSMHIEKGYEGVSSPIDGHIFKNKADHSEYMKRNNLTLKE